MGADEYLLGFLAILSGLAITDMVTSLHGLLRRWRKVRFDLIATCAALIVFESVCYSWWITWRSNFNGTSFGLFMFAIVQMIALFLAAKAVLPDDDGTDAEVDLAHHYWTSNRYVWLAMTVPNATILLLQPVLDATPFGDTGEITNALYRVGYILMSILLAVVQRRWLHLIAVPVILIWITWLWSGLVLTGTV